jgi:hypothetical protein
VAQGGFAGDPLTVPEHRLPKFAGRIACESFFARELLAALASPQIERRELVSKNITQGIAWDGDLQPCLSRSGLTG